VTSSLRLPTPSGPIAHTPSEPGTFPAPQAPFSVRKVFAAPHVTVDALADYTPGESLAVEWDATLGFRRHLYRYGLGVAEAMDTAERERGGLGWATTRELIRRSLELAAEVGGAVVCGVGTEQLDDPAPSLARIRDAYLEQLDHVQSLGGRAVIRASHALARIASTPEDYAAVYDPVLSAVEGKAIVHWIGAAFEPRFAGYWGSSEPSVALSRLVELAGRHAERLMGIKFSLLDVALEEQLRAALPEGVEVYTGDDHDYPDLILGRDGSHSQGLLGVFDPLAPIVSVALQALEDGREQEYLTTMRPTLPLARKMFEAPASRYRTGVVLIAYLSGHQDHFRMATGQEGFRSPQHLAELYRLADGLGLFPDPELAAERIRRVLAVSGWEA
jgi:hypothetical protein